MARNTVQTYEPMAKLLLDDEARIWSNEVIARLESEFDKMDGVDTDGIEPLVSVLDLCNVLREDVSEKKFSREEVLRNAPEEYDGYFQVPKTLE